MKERTKLIIVIFLMLVLGMALGYGAGVKDGITWSVKFASNFVSIDFDEEFIADGIFRYKNQIGGCFEDHGTLNNTN